MPRFSVPFAKRKPAVDDLPNGNVTSPERPSFRVIERSDVSGGKSFDGGARMARASKILTPKTNFIELDAQENIFANLKPNRGSGVSNTTNTTSTDNSSRHSNTSTAPSSTDMTSANAKDAKDEAKKAAKPPAASESPSRGSSKSNFLDRATRTFSFGGQKKHTIPPPKEMYVPDVPPVLRLNGGSRENRSRGMTTSSVSTATPAHPAGGGELDLGGDFGAMFSSFDKRASTATLTIVGAKPANKTSSPTAQLSPNPPATSGSADTPQQMFQRGRREDGSPSGRAADAQSAQSRYPTLHSFKSSTQPPGVFDDEDARLLRDSFTVLNSLNASQDKSMKPPPSRRAEGPRFLAPPESPSSSAALAEEDNMFAGSPSRRPQPAQRHVPQSTSTARNKVMTAAQFEQYRQDKERQGRFEQAVSTAATNDEEDDINYDDEDEQEKSKQQARQRRKQEAHMTIYRQQMMKVTGDTTGPEPPRASRPGLLSPSAPQLSLANPVSPDTTTAAAAAAAPAGDEDEDVPLGILQANGFPSKNRPPTRMSHAAPPSMRLSQGAIPTRPISMTGDSLASAARRHSTLPAFARNLPQDPFSGPNAARSHGRESMSFADNPGHPVPLQQQPPHQAGGLVGVIQNEERFRAMRRGSPSVDGTKLFGSVPRGPSPGHFDAAAAGPYPIMYGAGGMPAFSPSQPSLTPGDQAQIQMTQQMQQFMQIQMHFMYMMAANQNGAAAAPSQSRLQSPYGVGLPATQSMADLSSRHSFVGDHITEPRRIDHGTRSMSMVQPGPIPALYMAAPHPSMPPAPPLMHGAAGGYTPSIAPSERSNVGLPGRYRPVSQASATPAQGHGYRPSTSSLVPSKLQGEMGKPASQGREKSRGGDDDDDEQGWEAMKEKRDKKRSMWKKKKSFGSDLALSLGGLSR